jgi:alkylation response protein AidB-like acyl-CoA dehydrogenase
MFQMMNEARIMVGVNGVATASVAYHEAVAYARERPQGRRSAPRIPRAPPVPITEHADVRRMLLRQKAIVEGGLALLVRTARYADLAQHAPTRRPRDAAAAARPAHADRQDLPRRARLRGQRARRADPRRLRLLERVPAEAWLRDQKLNTIHEGTTGIQALDLLGPPRDGRRRRRAAWQWLELAAAVTDRDPAHRAVTRASAAYWFATELPRIHHLAALCRSAERSFVDLDPAWL